MYTITLADGTKIEDLRKNGNNYVSPVAIDEHVFTGNTATVVITNDEDEPELTLNNAELIQEMLIVGGAVANEAEEPLEFPDGWYLTFRELSDAELLMAQVTYTALMTDTLL
jgi:hypothetical protein